jgi:hypothetical protein
MTLPYLEAPLLGSDVFQAMRLINNQMVILG